MCGGRDGRVEGVSVEKCGGGMGKCVKVWGELGCVEKCGEVAKLGSVWGV